MVGDVAVGLAHHLQADDVGVCRLAPSCRLADIDLMRLGDVAADVERLEERVQRVVVRQRGIGACLLLDFRLEGAAGVGLVEEEVGEGDAVRDVEVVILLVDGSCVESVVVDERHAFADELRVELVGVVEFSY